MATYVLNPPAGAIPCGSGSFTVSDTPSEAAALAIAKLGLGAYVGAHVERVTAARIQGDPELAILVAMLRTPQALYILGDAAQTGPRSWQIPFEVFVTEGG